VKALSNLRELKTLIIWSSQIKDYLPISNLTNLETLIIHQKSEYGSIDSLSNLTNLKYLDLNGFSKSEMRFLTSLNKIEYLDIENSGIISISPLKNMRKLNWLSIKNTPITNVEELSNLMRIDFIDCSGCNIENPFPLFFVAKNIIANGFNSNEVYLEKFCPYVEDLMIYGEDNDLVYENRLFSVFRHQEYPSNDTKRLHHFYRGISRNHVFQINNVKFLFKLSNLKSLRIGRITDEELRLVGSLTNLESLHAVGKFLEPFVFLKNSDSLQSIALISFNKISLKSCALVKNLKAIFIVCERVEHLESLRPLLGNTKIYLSVKNIINEQREVLKNFEKYDEFHLNLL
jgi:hypothetical protein